MSKIAIHGRKIRLDSVNHVADILQILEKNNREIFISPDLKELEEVRPLLSNYPIYSPGELSGFEAVFSLGGDGTLLDTVTHVADSEIPILGINLGRLGFLAVISKENIPDALNAYFLGNYTFDDRSLLQVETSAHFFEKHNFGLNEFAILRKDTSSMIVVKCYLNGEYLNTYWADGLMIATPTGSTGYSLSCGGPIIMPNTRNFIITPISPHNLNVRPLIIPDDGELLFRVESQNQSYQVSLDSRSASVSDQFEFKIVKAPFHARLIEVQRTSFLDTLRNKLTWGLDKRN